MSDFREAYFKAREEFAENLKQKYNRTESHKDDNRLTLDCSNYSIHLTFDIPEGDDINVTDHNNEFYNDSFMGLVVKKYPNTKEMGVRLKSLFKTIDFFDSSYEYIHSSLFKKIKFIEEEYPTLLNT